MGSRLSITKKATDLAYIAGFLDGDGSLMLQVKKRSDTKRGWRFMVTICLYQDSRHEKPLYWMRKCFGIGYISKRNDGITELRVNGYRHCSAILQALQPYIKFKKLQADALLRAMNILEGKRIEEISIKERRIVLSCVQTIQDNNYHSPRKRSTERLKEMLSLTP